MLTRNYDPKGDAAVTAIVADVLTRNPLPSAPAGLSWSDRRRLNLAAEEQGITPEAFLALVRADHATLIALGRPAHP